jgi:hypothetical protein
VCSLELTSFLSIDKRGSSETSCQLPLCREGHGETKGYGPQLAGHTLTCGGACGLQLLLGVSRILARLPERRKLFKRAYRTLWLLFCGLVPQLPRWVASARDSYTILFCPQETPILSYSLRKGLLGVTTPRASRRAAPCRRAKCPRPAWRAQRQGAIFRIVTL